MSRDLVSEKRHGKELKRRVKRMRGLLKGDGSGKHKHGSMGNDAITLPGSRERAIHEPKGPKKFKWKRDILLKGRG